LDEQLATAREPKAKQVRAIRRMLWSPCTAGWEGGGTIGTRGRIRQAPKRPGKRL
jgi:hypothetical protein